MNGASHRLAPAMMLLAGMLLAGGCSDSSVSSTSVPASTTVRSTSPTTAPPVDTTVAPPAPQLPPGGLVVANAEGAFLLDEDFLFQLFGGPVELALDDGDGGLVFQQSSDAGLREPRTTTIYYLPADSFEPQELLVPGDQYLKLRDVQDGVVWYTRTEGDTPDTSLETLRTYDLSSRTVDQLAITGGWESGSIDISVGGSTVVAYWSAEAATGFEYYQAESAQLVGFDGDPYGNTGFCGDGLGVFDRATGDLVGDACFEYAQLSDDGRLAYYEREFDGAATPYVLVIVDLVSGEELFRQDLERPDQGWVPKGMDLLGDWLLVNRTAADQYDAPYMEALLIDLTTGTVLPVGVSGQARFLSGPMGIN
ncbi:MAG: hypothetical protein HKN80_03135 [Acidimicrobiia bacterium]|nr:hypothetical protein [Acidimicrobiia bacterium]